MSKETGPTLDSETARWVARCHANYYFAHAAPPRWPLVVGREKLYPSWDQYDLPYEPRSIAVSTDEKRVAIGTKSGTLVTAQWRDPTSRSDGDQDDPSFCAWEISEIHIPGEPKDHPGSAIRAMSYIGSSQILVASGIGRFHLVDADSAEIVACTGHDSNQHSPNRWFDLRLRRILPLSLQPNSTEGPIALGLSESAEVWVIKRAGNRLGATPAAPLASSDCDVLNDLKHDSGERVVDLSRIQGSNRIIGLTNRSRLFSYEPGTAATAIFSEPLPYAGTGGARQIAACQLGVAILTTSNRLGFFPLSTNNDWIDQFADVSKRAKWTSARGARSISLWRPWPDQNATSNIVHAFIATTTRGVVGRRFIIPQDTTKAVLTNAAAMRLPSGGGASLYVTVAQPRQERAYIFYAAQHHRLTYASIINRKHIDAAKDQARAILQPGSREHDLLEALWRIEEGKPVDDTIDHANSGVLAEPSLLASLNLDDLRRLARQLVRKADDASGPSVGVESFKRWTFHLIHRGQVLGAQAPREIAGIIRRGIERHAEHTTGGNNPAWEELRPFGSFLRKWVIRGHTYAEKELELQRLVEWNADRSGEQRLDALIYQLRVDAQHHDPIWRTADVQPNTTVWCLEAGPAGIVFRTLSNGKLLATSRDGKQIRWLTDDASLDHRLQIVDGRCAIQAYDRKRFDGIYKHAPYMRAIAGAKLDNEAFLLLFSIKGWRRADLQDPSRHSTQVSPRKPLLVVLVLDINEDSLSIRAHSVNEFDSEIHSIARVGLPASGSNADRLEFAIGTSGAWWSDRDEEIWKTSAVCPFVRVAIAVHNTTIDWPTPIPMTQDKAGALFDPPHQARSALEDETTVPGSAEISCLALAATQHGETERVWAGMRDGTLREYIRRPADNERWKRTSSRSTGSAIRAIFYDPASQLLWYGTAHGMYGAIPVGETESERPEMHVVHGLEHEAICSLIPFNDESQRAQRNRVAIVTAAGVVAVHQAGTSSTEDDTDQTLTPLADLRRCERLQIGRDVWDCVASDHGSNDCDPDSSPVSLTFGCRNGELLKANLTPTSPISTDVDTSGARRLEPGDLWKAITASPGSFQFTSLLPSVSGRHTPWLRILDVGDDFVAQFAMKTALQELAAGVNAKKMLETMDTLMNEAHARGMVRFGAAKALWSGGAEWANRRAATAWTKLTRHVKEDTADAPNIQTELNAYLDVTEKLENFCNRWIHIEPAVEGRVLMYSFKHLFDANDVLILAWAKPSATGRKIRTNLLHNLLHRRLVFPDRVVQLETIRVINEALLDAIFRIAIESQSAFQLDKAPAVEPNECDTPSDVLRWPGWTCRLALRPCADAGYAPTYGPPWHELQHLGFVDVMTMVGNLAASQFDRLTKTDPIDTAIVTFFARCLVLMPHCAYNIGQTVSESLLLERDPLDRSNVIVRHAELAVDAIHWRCREQGLKICKRTSDAWRIARDRFKAYLSNAPPNEPDPERGQLHTDIVDARNRLVTTKANNSLGGTQNGSWWEQDPARWARPFTDDAKLVDQAYILTLAAGLCRLSRSDESQGATEPRNWWDRDSHWFSATNTEQPCAEQFKEALNWVKRVDPMSADSTRRTRYYAQSARYLCKLHKARNEMVMMLDQPLKKGHMNARKRCNELLLDLEKEDLFEPQRTQYRAIITGWRSQLDEQTNMANRVLTLIARFHRHAHVREADRLIDKLFNFLTTVEPVVFTPETDRRPIAEYFSDAPSAYATYRQAERHVERTHLA